MKRVMEETAAREYLKEVENGNISLDVSVQRGNDKWSLAQKSSLIESMIKGYPIPAICTVNYEGVDVVIDGLQRTTAIHGFYNDEFALEGVEDSLSGKRFSELDSQSQQSFCDYKLNLVDAGEVSEEELSEIFLRLNNGTALSKTQKTRGFLGSSVAEWAKEMCSHPLFTKLAKFTDKQFKDDAPLECLLQGVMLIHGCLGDENGSMYPWKNISRDEVQKYCMDVLSKASRKQLDEYGEIISYLDGADVSDNYEKTFIPILIVLAKYAMLSGISEEEFNDYIVRMRTNLPAGYGAFRGAGNVSKAKTIGRIKVLINDFNGRFTEVKKPEINLDASRAKSVKKVASNTKTDKKAKSKKLDEKPEELSVELSGSDVTIDVSIEVAEESVEAGADILTGASGADATADVLTEVTEKPAEDIASVSSVINAEAGVEVSEG